MKKIISLLGICICIMGFAFADESLSVVLGADRTVTIGDTVEILAEVGGSCSNLSLSSIYWQELNDKGDWMTKQSGGISNTSYSFIADMSKDVRIQVRCPIGAGPIFTDELIAEDTILIMVNPETPIVNPGQNKSYKVGSTVSLSGSISGFDASCTLFNYQWEQLSGPDVEILNSGQFMLSSPIFDAASFVFPTTSENVVLKLYVSPQSCANSLYTYSGVVTYSKQSTGGGGSSYSATMQKQAIDVFKAEEKPILVLKKDDLISAPNYTKLSRNSLGGYGYIRYALDYSTGSDFSHYQTYFTSSDWYLMYKLIVDATTDVLYARVKAYYNGISTEYSNVVTIYPVDYLPIKCISCNKQIDFSDVWREPDVLIDSVLKKTCNTQYASCKVNR